ncbi:MAG: class I SAM-dependent rRNA methyltransferase [Alphaproteobacteria bacterium]|nr:class I SAM-dependent rRNA methyltransferase [Alphaproteobacteria bacterium]
MSAANYPVVTLLPGRHKRAEQGHPWVYSNEIQMDKAAKALPPGSLVRLAAVSGKPLGVATFNPHALVAARIVDRDPARAIDRAFITERLEAAVALRHRLYPEPFYRAVHAEADGLPGLVVDRFGDVVVAQMNTAGMARLEDEIVAALAAALAPKTVALRNDGAGRKLEGLTEEVRLAMGALDGPVALVENGARFFADPLGGQKTGWFFDQRENRRTVAALAKDCRVLDAYCFAGGFAVTAAHAGARAVLAVDRSEAALALAARAAAENGVEARCRFMRAEAFAELERLAVAGERFDIVVADPPAFVKSKKDIGPGLRGYRKLARLAASVVAPRGLLFIASCSHNVGVPEFADAVRRGVADAGRSGRVLQSAGAAPDHPVHPFLPESAYLKSELLALD